MLEAQDGTGLAASASQESQKGGITGICCYRMAWM